MQGEMICKRATQLILMKLKKEVISQYESYVNVLGNKYNSKHQWRNAISNLVAG